MKTPRLRRSDEPQEPLSGNAVPITPGPDVPGLDPKVVGESLDRGPAGDDLNEAIHGGGQYETYDPSQHLSCDDLGQKVQMDRERVARRLREARAAAGYETGVDAARAFGWNETTYGAHENAGRGLRPNVAAKYARAFHVKSSWLLYGEGMADTASGHKLDRRIPVIGEVRAGAWTEMAYADEVQEEISISLPEYDRAQLFGLRVAGRSMNRLYKEGEIVVVCPVQEAGIRNEDIVVVRRSRNGLVENTLKQLQVTAGGIYELWPRSDDPSHRQPIRFQRAGNVDDGVEIIGVVVAAYRPGRSGRGPSLNF